MAILEKQLRAITPELMPGSSPNFNHTFVIPYTQIFSRLRYLAVRPPKYLFAGNDIRDWVPK
jgi:hypothetical protein